MLVAIIAAVVAALVAAAIIVVVLSVRNRAKTPYANSGKKEVQQLSTVGVGSSGGFARGKGTSSRPESDVQVKTTRTRQRATSIPRCRRPHRAAISTTPTASRS